MSSVCSYYKYDSGFFGKGDTCSVTGEVESVSSSYYNSYCCHDYTRGDCPRFKEYGPYQSSWCFITTVVCEILGNDDNCKLLNSLRSFRDNILQRNEKYYNYLWIYDNIGPMIADSIICDNDKDEMALDIYDNMLMSINELYKRGEYDAACEMYRRMTYALVYYYGLESYCDNVVKCFDCSFNPEVLGHGRKLIKSLG